jgi:hypothetical protein
MSSEWDGRCMSGLFDTLHTYNPHSVDSETSSGQHKVKVSGVMVSEEAGTREGIQNTRVGPWRLVAISGGLGRASGDPHSLPPPAPFNPGRLSSMWATSAQGPRTVRSR